MDSELFSADQLVLVRNWLEEQRELYLDIFRIRKLGDSSIYMIRSEEELLNEVNHAFAVEDEAVFTVFRRNPYHLSGTIDGDFVEQALAHIPDGTWYRILTSVYTLGAHLFDVVGGGLGHAELRSELLALEGESVYVGHHPWDADTDPWLSYPPDQLLAVAFQSDEEGFYQLFERYADYIRTRPTYNHYRAVERTLTLRAINEQRCSRCGLTSEERMIITRAPCEVCKQVICYECVRKQEHGSLSDYQHFLKISETPVSGTPAELVRLDAYMCPTCYRHRR